ncbi:heterokaryon incompatibility protein-domain-containing protein, partial [Immersiella caudata]
LPTTLQDAVTATKALGLRYLWIDSLYIIQDSESDWATQCAQMAHIYVGSFVSLAADAASDCESGFLRKHERKPQGRVETQLPRGNRISLFAYGQNELEESDRYQPHFRFQKHHKAPIFRRAWMLQEMLLSGRVLHFDVYKTLMGCWLFARFICKNNKIKIKIKKKKFRRIHTLPHWRPQWLVILDDYLNRALTRRTDRLAALSGVASRVQELTGEQYLAGVWMSHFPSTLTWITADTDAHEEPIDYIAPPGRGPHATGFLFIGISQTDMTWPIACRW